MKPLPIRVEFKEEAFLTKKEIFNSSVCIVFLFNPSESTMIIKMVIFIFSKINSKRTDNKKNAIWSLKQ